VFTEKVLQARAATDAEADKAYFERACEVCQKTYYSENAYQNHLLSQKHKLKVSSTGSTIADDEATSVVSSSFSLGDPVPVRRNSVDSDAEEEFNQVIEGFSRSNISQEQRPSPVKRPSNPQPAASDAAEKEAQNGRESNNTTPVQGQADPAWTITSCIFCNYSSPTVPLNVHHMERFHGMFIPEKPYLVNLEGLIDQLQHRVHDGHECLYCGKISSTVFGVQTHMRDKGHCKIPFTTEEEQLDIGEFYDFRSTYSDEEDEDEDEEEGQERNGGAKLGGKRDVKLTGPDGETLEAENGDGWETDSSASSLDSEDLTGVPADNHFHQYDRLGKHPHHSNHDPRHRHQVDGWHSHAHKHTHAAFYDEYELHLPTGKSVGHRSLNKYYRQNLHNYPTPEERAERERQLLENGSAEDGEDGETNGQLTQQQGRGRAMVPRGAAGMIGVSDKKKELAKKSEQRGRTQENDFAKKKDMVYGTKLNNHKSYYYRYNGGG
jgi:pre-60S factor REI1